MSTFNTISFRLGAGSLQITQRDPQERWVCSCCSQEKLGAATFKSENVQPDGDGASFEGIICGDCIAGGMAIMFGRMHVQSGGNVRDLDFERIKRERGDKPELSLEPDPTEGQHQMGRFTDRCSLCGRSRKAIIEGGPEQCPGRPQ